MRWGAVARRISQLSHKAAGTVRRPTPQQDHEPRHRHGQETHGNGGLVLVSGFDIAPARPRLSKPVRWPPGDPSAQIQAFSPPCWAGPPRFGGPARFSLAGQSRVACLPHRGCVGAAGPPLFPAVWRDRITRGMHATTPLAEGRNEGRLLSQSMGGEFPSRLRRKSRRNWRPEPLGTHHRAIAFFMPA